MARVLSGEASPADKDELDRHIQSDAELGRQFELLKKLWHAKPFATADPSSSIDELLRRARSIEEQSLPSIPSRSYWAMRKWFAAAAILLFVFAGWRWLHPSSISTPVASHQISYTDSVVTRNGNRQLEVLPGGTKVWLNAGSRLNYSKAFDGATREVELEGEAYFDVAHLPRRPFIVHIGEVQVKVLGTLFNVKSYAADASVTTTLVHGSVAISRTSRPDEILYTLKPREKLTVRKYAVAENNNAETPAEQQQLLVEKIDTVHQIAELPETAWVYNRLVFRAENFETLAARMERWFNVEIIFSDEAVKRQTVSGSFENENIEQALKALQDVAPFRYAINNKKITISSLH
jgi:transmembrane sensor